MIWKEEERNSPYPNFKHYLEGQSKTMKNLYERLASECEPGILQMRIRMDICNLEMMHATPIIPHSYFSTLNLFRCMSRFSGGRLPFTKINSNSHTLKSIH